MKKSGVSDVVATVIIIALTIVAITVVWLGVMPLIRDKIGGSDVCNDVDVSIESSQGYTCLDAKQGITMVQVKKGSNAVDVSGLKFFVSYGGNSYSYSTDFSFAFNSYKTFYLKTYGAVNLDKLEIVPIAKSGNAKRDCASVVFENLKNCSIGLVPASELLDEKVKPTSSGAEYYIDGCRKISSCQTISVPGCYRLNQSISATGTCFTMMANNITLDGNDNTILGAGSYEGILNTYENFIVIKNLRIVGFSNGIRFWGNSYNDISNVVISGSSNSGIFISGLNNKFTNINVSSAPYGLYLADSSCNNNTFANIFITNSSEGGIYAGAKNYFNEFTNLYLNSNKQALYLSTSYSNGALHDSGNIFSNLNIWNCTSTLGCIRLQDASGNTFNGGVVNLSSSNLFYLDHAVDDSNNNNLVNLQMINAANSIFFKNSPYEQGVNNKIIYNNAFGEIQLMPSSLVASGNITFPGSVLINNNFAHVSSTISGLNVPANITLYGVGGGTQILKNGVACGSECYAFTSLGAGTVKFNVTYAAANYSIG